MSGQKAMRNGQPVRYWIFRDLVSIVQLAIVLLLLAGLTVWLLADNNGVAVWDGYVDFSKGVSNWAHGLNLPWE